MFLGGSTQQIPAIQYAKDQGYYTILCDYIPDNPGQNFSDEFYCVSTTDKEAILAVAKETNVDAIVAYASDPAALTAAYVGSKLDFPCNPYKSVLTLSRKDLFRKFLVENGFNCPRAESFKVLDEAKESIVNFKFPLMVKPVDSSGSKGVTRIDSKEQFEKAFDIAMDKSREKIVIVEEFIEMAHACMIGGDAFILDGKLKFCGFLNSHRDPKVNQFVPIGTSFPLFMDDDKKRRVRNEVQRVCDLLNIKMGALNLELMFDKNEKLYIIEIGPRNGGNMIPDLLQMVTGVNLIGATVDVALGNNNINLNYEKKEAYFSTYVVHSSQNGILKNISYSDKIKNNIIKKVLYKNENDNIEKFNGSNNALGIIFLKYESLDELEYKTKHINELVKVELK